MEIHNNIIELSVGAAFMLVICYFLSWRNKPIDDTNPREGILLGIYFGLSAVIGMLIALEVSEGVIFDARSMLIGVGSFFGGPVVAVIASAIAASYRLVLGGAGALSGIGVISLRLIPGVENRRVPAVEVLLRTPFIADLIEKGEVSAIKDAMEKGSDLGMQTFDQSLYALFESGKISQEEALKNADSATNLSVSIRLAKGVNSDDESDLEISN